MSCQGCAIAIDCLEVEGNDSDISPSFGFFATQDYTFTLDCPAGYICSPFRDPVKIIPATIIPSIVWNGGPMCLQGCLSLLCVTPLPTASQSDLNGLANFLFFEWAQQQAACNNRTKPQGPGLPPPTRVGGQGNRVKVSNKEQTFTAHCVPDSAGTPKTVTIPAGVYSTTLFNPTTSAVAVLQTQMDSIALAQATSNATAMLACFGAACHLGTITWFATTVNPTFPNTGSLSHTHPTGSSARVVASATCGVNVGSGQEFGEDNFGMGIAFPPLAAPCLCKITVNVRSISGFAKTDFALYLNGSATPTVVVFPAATPAMGVTIYNFTMPIATALVEMYYHVVVGNPSATANGSIDIEFDFGI